MPTAIMEAATMRDASSGVPPPCRTTRTGNEMVTVVMQTCSKARDSVVNKGGLSFTPKTMFDGFADMMSHQMNGTNEAFRGMRRVEPPEVVLDGL